MEKITLEAQVRKELGKSKVKALRIQGFIPAVIYGRDIQSFPIKLSKTDLLRLIRKHPLEATVINLKVKDTDKKFKEYSCLVKEIQYSPLSDEIIHVDFNQISLTELIKIKVPVVAKGEPIGVKQESGTLEHVLWEVEIECLPTDIPAQIEVDVSNLKINEVIQIKDIKVSDKIKILNPAEAIVFSLLPPKEEEVTAVAEEEKAEPEVIKEKKETKEETPQE
ncbi:MAG: 50S ribosomal protein L25 [Candidatus Omnitrophica bacterium]|nr:50S ribosomal protein L25 [Candidatus Omnitrophota bacterium]MCM8800380.1 50S ribosomal protein L25 [Candidatus Omnitrophota bacterium]